MSTLCPQFPAEPTPEPREPETDAQARARAFEMLREIAELGLRAARVATVRIETNAASPEPALSLTLARATNAARQAIALEQRLRTGIVAPAPARTASPRPIAARDPRRTLLRDALRKAAQSEPDRAARTQLCRFIDERVDAELADDPDAAIPVAELLVAISDEIGLPIDLSQLPSELLGLPPIGTARYADADLDHPARDTG